jgi:DNA-binding response OmpR family regulator
MILKSGEKIVESILELKPDLILLDMMLPVKNGMTILNELKGNDDVKNIPVIMLSVHGEEQKVEQELTSVAVDYILKPFSTEELSERILKLLA